MWRVLAANGRLLVVAPNRRGLWARFDHTPFGHGQPYTTGQLSRLLRDSRFTPTRTESALFAPPYTSSLIVRSAPAIEQIGKRWFTTFAGVAVIEISSSWKSSLVAAILSYRPLCAYVVLAS